MNNTPSGKRNFKRLDVECGARAKLGGEEFDITIQNLSGQGLCIKTDKPLKVSDLLSVFVRVSRQPDPFVLTGTVVWIKAAAGDQTVAGIKLDFTSWTIMSKLLKGG